MPKIIIFRFDLQEVGLSFKIRSIPILHNYARFSRDENENCFTYDSKSIDTPSQFIMNLHRNI